MPHLQTFLTLLLSLLLSGILSSCEPIKKGQAAESKEASSSEQGMKYPLFVLGGFSQSSTNISQDSLQKLYQNQGLYLLKASQKDWEKILGPGKPRLLNSLNDFAPIAKNNLLLSDIHHLDHRFRAWAIEEQDFFEPSSEYPYWGGTDSLTFDYAQEITKFTLTGVTAITRNTGFAADNQGLDFLAEYLLPEVQDSDLLHISNEVSFSEGCYYKKYDPSYKFCSKKEHFELLKMLGADIIELTGNHNLDYGLEAYQKTYEWYQSQGMKIFGGGLNAEQANSPLVIELKDKSKLGFIGFNEYCPVGECTHQQGMGANLYEKEKARRQIQKMRQEMQVDWIIATVQFGEVDSYAPTSTQSQISHDLIDFGADMVYGSQAHQAQQIEFYQGKVIFHGLGNFIFDQVHRIGVRQAYFVHQYFYQGQVIQSRPVYTFMAMNRQPKLANEAEKKQIQEVTLKDELLYHK